MSMTNIKRKNRHSLKKFIKLRNKIFFINNDVMKNVFIITNLSVNSRAKITVTFFTLSVVTSSFRETKMCKDRIQ